MIELKILFISDINNNSFLKLSNRLERNLLRSQSTIYAHLQFKDILELKKYKDIVRKYDLIILNIDKNLCSQAYHKFEHELQYLINRFPNKLILLIDEKCETEICTPGIEEVRHILKYQNINDIEHVLAHYIEDIIHNEDLLSNDLFKDTSRAEYLLKEKEKKIDELEKKSQHTQLKGEQAIVEKKFLQDEAKKLKEKIAFLEEEKQKETDNIEKIITFLAAMPKEISEEQEYLKDRRKRFTQFGGFFLSFGVLTSIVMIGNMLSKNKLCLPSIVNTPQYFAYALAIGFPMAIAFLFYRQANVKSKEIEKINEKSILVQQVENALNSYNVLLSGDELKEKTISSIDRVINKIFDNNHKEDKNENIEESKLTISDVQKLFKMGTDITKP